MSACPTCGRELQLAQGSLQCPDCQIAEPQKPKISAFVTHFRRFPATTSLIAINVLVFVAMLLAGVSPVLPTGAQLIRWGADSGEHVIMHNQWWRILTAAFVHIGFVHLLMNMWALWVLGTLAEAILGTYLFTGTYLVCAIAGSLASLFWNPLMVGAGASGAIMGILGVAVSVLKFARLPLPKQALRSTIRSLVQGAVLTLAIGLVGPIDNAAHVGGLLCGLLMGLLLSLTRRADYTLQRPLRQACLVVPFAAMVPLAFAVQRHGEPEVHMLQAARAIQSSHYEQAEKEARIALKKYPNRRDVLEVLSTALLNRGDHAAAAGYLRQLIEQNPRNEFALNNLALIDLQENDLSGARDLLTKTLPSQSRNAYGQVYLGRALQELNEDDQAIEHYRQAVEIDPNLYEAQLALASIYEKHAQSKQAILFYRKASQIRPDELDPLRGLARTYLAAGMKPQADQTLARIRSRGNGK